MIRRSITAVLSVAALTLSSCGSDDKHNAADVTFTSNMIPHHAGAIEMAKWAETNANDAEVKSLAAQIKMAQQPEIDTMNQWLEGWNQPKVDPNTALAHAGHMGVPGMMSGESMAQLHAAKGPEFDKMFLQMMVEHHRGAIDMAQSELKDGSDAAAKKLARNIASSQQAEVDHMNQLLTRID